LNLAGLLHGPAPLPSREVAHGRSHLLVKSRKKSIHTRIRIGVAVRHDNEILIIQRRTHHRVTEITEQKHKPLAAFAFFAPLRDCLFSVFSATLWCVIPNVGSDARP
jgi:hypothetical protein